MARTIKEVRAEAERYRFSLTELANASGLSVETVRRALSDIGDPLSSTVGALDKGIDRVIAKREAAAQAILSPTAAEA